MRCKELEAILEQGGLSSLPLEAQEHLAECPDCQDFFADLSAILVTARQLPAEVSPPDRIWISLRAQLAAEGIIREQGHAELSPSVSWWLNFSRLFRPRLLASVGAGMFVVLSSIYLAERPWLNTVQPPPAPVPPEFVKTDTIIPPAPEQPPPVAPVKRESITAHRVSVPPQAREFPEKLLPSPSESAYLGESAAVLTATENALPGRELAGNAMADASLRENLRTLNGFIAECEARLKQNPQDQLTREYLNVAYQQKAELLTAMMDSGRSEH